MKYLPMILGLLALIGVVTAGVAGIHNDGIAVGKAKQETLQKKAIAQLKADYKVKIDAMRTADLRQIEQANARIASIESTYSDVKKELAVSDAKKPEKLERYRNCRLDNDDLKLLQRSGYSGERASVGADTKQLVNTSLLDIRKTGDWIIARITRPLSGQRETLLRQPMQRSLPGRFHSFSAERYGTA